MVSFLHSKTHQHYLFAVVGGSHNKTFTGFPLGGLSSQIKISEDIIERHTAFFTTSVVPKHSHNQFWSRQPALSWRIRCCSPPCLLMPINLSWCQTTAWKCHYCSLSPEALRMQCFCDFYHSNHPFLGVLTSSWPQRYSPSIPASCMPLKCMVTCWPNVWPKAVYHRLPA